MLDTLELSNEIRPQLIQLEFTTFQVIKKALVEDMGPFVGSLEQNKKADLMISNTIRTSLRTYEEKTKKSYDKSYFSFK